MRNSSLYGVQWHKMLSPKIQRDYDTPRPVYPTFDQRISNIGWGLSHNTSSSYKVAKSQRIAQLAKFQSTCSGQQTRLNRNIPKRMIRSFDFRKPQIFTGLNDTFASHIDKSLGVQTALLSRMTVPEARGIVHRRAGATTIHGFHKDDSITNSSNQSISAKMQTPMSSRHA